MGRFAALLKPSACHTASLRELCDTPISSFPTMHQFTAACRLADDGDEDANRKLDSWSAAVPGLIHEATDFVAIARRHLIDFLAGESQESIAALQRKMDELSAALQSQADDDPLARLFADAVTVAAIDHMRSLIASLRSIDETATANYWDRASDRTQRRFIRIAKAYEQYLKQASKRSTAKTK